MPRASEALIMRAEPRGGRLIVTEVRAAGRQRRGVFRASRDGERLQLLLSRLCRGISLVSISFHLIISVTIKES
jgi:hypothetical protein